MAGRDRNSVIAVCACVASALYPERDMNVKLVRANHHNVVFMKNRTIRNSPRGTLKIMSGISLLKRLSKLDISPHVSDQVALLFFLQAYF